MTNSTKETMPTYYFQWPTGYAAHMTVPQYEKACRIAQQWNMGHTVTVNPVFMLKGAVDIDTGTMHIVVMEDGSSHS